MGLNGPEQDLIKALEDAETLIVCLPPKGTSQQFQLVDATSKADIKRLKEAVYAHIKKTHVPYTIIDTGVWHEFNIPCVPLGKLDHAALMDRIFLVGDGEMPCATTAIQDIGCFVAHVIVDPRTLNCYIFAYGEHVTQNKYIALAREITGEDVPYMAVTSKQVLDLAHQPETAEFTIWQKGGNEASYAKYLGYLEAHDLYAELKVKSLEESMREAYAGGKGFAVQVGDESFWTGLEELFV
ncbi:hypothetical protein AARAC_010922 [Aspergillus arachidicola]|uniref:Uncharacterized protein n=1 Tax=Aspergillus arachidicola TaxID=656916 RepID=A0A2G7FVH3_9EURO|nr:hypothetical protein AARAC_010922 [Aspergillus arachidicola]